MENRDVDCDGLSDEHIANLDAIEREGYGLPLTDQIAHLNWLLYEALAVLNATRRTLRGDPDQKMIRGYPAGAFPELDKLRAEVRSLPPLKQLGKIQWHIMMLMAVTRGANEVAHAGPMMKFMESVFSDGTSFAPLFSDEKEAMLAESDGSPEDFHEALLKRIASYQAAQRTDKAH